MSNQATEKQVCGVTDELAHKLIDEHGCGVEKDLSNPATKFLDNLQFFDDSTEFTKRITAVSPQMRVTECYLDDYVTEEEAKRRLGKVLIRNVIQTGDALRERFPELGGPDWKRMFDESEAYVRNASDEIRILRQRISNLETENLWQWIKRKRRTR